MHKRNLATIGRDFRCHPIPKLNTKRRLIVKPRHCNAVGLRLPHVHFAQHVETRHDPENDRIRDDGR